RVMVIGSPGSGTLRSLNDSVKSPTLRFRLTSTVLVVEAVWPALSVELKRTMYCPFSRDDGSKVPRVLLVTGAAPDANVTNVVGLPEPSSSEYSSFHVAVVTEPAIAVGAVISWPSVKPTMLTTGGGGGGATEESTVMVTCAVAWSCVSLARSCSTYTPAAPKVAWLTRALGLLNTTGTGPLKALHETESVLPAGRPSSRASPRSPTVFCGRVMVWLAPAVTAGG